MRRTIPAHLQAPGALVPFDVTTPRRLAFLRSSGGETTIFDGVDHRVVRVPRRDGAGATEVHLYEPPHRSDSSALVLFIHGGGFVAGGAGASHHTCSALAKDLGVVVANVEYRLAPEHPFPSAFEDCLDALQHMVRGQREFGLDPGRVVVSGESAGAGLAACVAQAAHDEGEIDIAGQVLTYPMIDDRTALRPADHRGLVVWTRKSNAFGWASYLNRTPSADPTPAYSVASRREDLAGLPATWIGVGTLDLFLDESITYARRLQAAGVDCELHVAEGLYHGADALAAIAGTPEVAAFVASRNQAFQRMLSRTVG